MLREEGSISLDHDYYEGLLKAPLACHLCGERQRNMPTLKRHVADCGRE